MTKTSDFEIVSTRQRRIAELAKQMPRKALTSLNHHLDMQWMREAYRLTPDGFWKCCRSDSASTA